MGDIGPNPLLTLCTPPILLDTASATSTAIRMSILSISTAHFAQDTSNEAANLLGEGGNSWSSRQQSLETVSKQLKKAALSNITLATGQSLGPSQGRSLALESDVRQAWLTIHSGRDTGGLHSAVYQRCT